MVLMQKYADILIGAGWFPVLDDINEDLLQYTVAKQQIPADRPTPARLFGFKKSMPLGYKETVTEQVRKFYDKIIAPQEATPEEFKDKPTNKGEEDSHCQKNTPKEITEGQGLEGDTVIAVDDEGSNRNNIYNKNNVTSKCKRTLEEQAHRKKRGKYFKKKN